ncbi:MAG TPA: DUF393 domain-containing protein [Bacteroidia bacterium]|jgi:predicted DCC family thiol-disulfide oxidoreductase YuxK|nr:DUF393 domain-containing protein [Bacteroidia bacterium]
MQGKNILFYDGDCALCNKAVQFVINHEKNSDNPLLFCSLQSAYAKQALGKHAYDFNNLSTLVLMINDGVYYKSDAALGLTKFFKKPYSLLIVLKLVPKFIRDYVYVLVAKNRKRLFKTTFCYMPLPQHKNRFIA